MEKPECKLIGEDGNAFNIIGRVSKTLEKSGKPDVAKEFQEKAFNCGSYTELLSLVSDYVEIV